MTEHAYAKKGQLTIAHLKLIIVVMVKRVLLTDSARE